MCEGKCEREVGYSRLGGHLQVVGLKKNILLSSEYGTVLLVEIGIDMILRRLIKMYKLSSRCHIWFISAV